MFLLWGNLNDDMVYDLSCETCVKTRVATICKGGKAVVSIPVDAPFAIETPGEHPFLYFTVVFDSHKIGVK